MALAPEFFVLLGVNIFVAVSVICALLDRHLSTILQFIFQGAAVAGLAELLISQGFSGEMRVWAGIVYVSCALSSLVAVNIRIAIVRRELNIAPVLSQMMTVPIVMMSALFLSSFLENGGQLAFSLASIITVVVFALVADLSVFGLLREYSRHGRIKVGGLFPFSTSPSTTGSIGAGSEESPSSMEGFALSPYSKQREEWEESPTQEKDQ